MRLSALLVILLCLSGVLGSQSLNTFQRMEACGDWRCVVAFAADGTLRLDRSIPWRLPLRGESATLTSGFGYRVHPIDGGRKFHAGVDIAAPLGSPVVASASGRVSTGYNPVLGYYVKIDHLNGFTSSYGHLDEVLVRPGDLVAQSAPIGTVGVSGRTTGPHLHWSAAHRSQSLDPLELRAALLAAF